jgi:hypothetical protein
MTRDCKGPQLLEGRKRGSGECWLRPPFRQYTGPSLRTFQRSVAIRTQPLPNSILLAETDYHLPLFSWASRFAPYPFEPSPPARRRKGNAHASEGWQSLHCFLAELLHKMHLPFRTIPISTPAILIHFSDFRGATGGASSGRIPNLRSFTLSAFSHASPADTARPPLESGSSEACSG